MARDHSDFSALGKKRESSLAILPQSATRPPLSYSEVTDFPTAFVKVPADLKIPEDYPRHLAELWHAASQSMLSAATLAN